MTDNTAALAIWLADHVDDIALHEDAGDFTRQLKHMVDRVLRMINRPIPPKFAGPCPTVVEHGSRCNAALLAEREAEEVYCSECGITHNIADVEAQLWSEVGQWLLTANEIHLVLKHFGEPVAESTLRRWRSTGKLQPRGYRDGKPRYWPSDVRDLRNAKTDRKAS